jgi:hypothetical protein
METQAERINQYPDCECRGKPFFDWDTATYNICHCFDDESEDDDEGDQCYSVDNVMVKRFTMAGGGSHWWNYYLEYNDKKSLLYIENKNGLEPHFNKVLVQSFNKDGDERLKMVDKNYELDEDKNECFITSCIL